MWGDPPHYHILGEGSVTASAMNFLMMLAAAAAAAAGAAIGDRSQNVRRPSDSIRLQAPLGQSQKHASASAPAAATEIIRYDSESNARGYRYAYETSDGTKAEQEGLVVAEAGELDVPSRGWLRVRGSYSFVGHDGRLYSVTYTADERGYRAEGVHLPAAAAVADLNSLQLADTSRGQYDSLKSSYDADAGY